MNVGTYLIGETVLLKSFASRLSFLFLLGVRGVSRPLLTLELKKLETETRAGPVALKEDFKLGDFCSL